MNPVFAEGHLFLAKAYLDREQNFDEAVRWRERGSSSTRRANTRRWAIMSWPMSSARQGQRAEAEREAARGQALERAKA